ncbi:hypothetical protein DS909_11845 [Phaeobacter gallaeciensis]|uniref:Uncharacterized protein n=2 Tax=Roseobacteraceae TaxID=2854170 RepID=A0A366WXX2_9RHOB|nr:MULTISPECIES: hypothetical protein [Roseobacteraceae]MBT3141154.1 hypothetical protein [Falsiruegeria litorea]MBT8170847.1 hypothetical protein [Falsiruegeria litorea]RBW54520.1 hypothetical protein DS909_11845 [Phaeobacter gallaeciensis]
MRDEASPPWAVGPGELLLHGVSLLREDSEAKRRIAMILIDNAVELTLQTYLTLPERITGVKLSRKQLDEYCSGFPKLLNGVEEHASEKLVGMHLGEFEWFHRLRNQLYHQGNGLTVEKRHVEVFAELSEKLFEALFDCRLKLGGHETDNIRLIGEFFELWIWMERRLSSVVPSVKHYSVTRMAEILVEEGEFSKADLNLFRQVQTIRNQLVHGDAETDEMLRSENMLKLKQAAKIVDEVSFRRLGIPKSEALA